MGMGADVMLDPNDLEKSFAPGPQLRDEALEHRPLPARPTSARSRCARSPSSIATQLTRADAWILDRLDVAIARMRSRARSAAVPDADATCGATTSCSAGLRLNEYAETARRFVWNELADWYLEAIKTRLATPGDDREVARAVLVHVFDRRCVCCTRSCRS